MLGVKKSLTVRPNGRSADFIAPSTANGCAMACAYCYVPRRKGYGNPVTVFANIDQITRALERHAARQGVKLEPNQCDPDRWVYDIGENSDCSVDALISDNVDDLVTPSASCRPPSRPSPPSTSTRHARLGPGGHTRVRFSLMPADLAKSIDVRTRRWRADRRDRRLRRGRVRGAPELLPRRHHEGWLSDWAELLRQLDDTLAAAAKAQLAAEVIFLTHNERLHEVNLGWHPQAEELLWRPDLQERRSPPTASPTSATAQEPRRAMCGS